MSWKMLLHKLVYRHRELYKPGVGSITICSSRFHDRNTINMSVSLDELYDTTYVIPNIKVEEAEKVLDASTENELAGVLVSMISWRRNAPEKYQVKLLTGDYLGLEKGSSGLT